VEHLLAIEGHEELARRRSVTRRPTLPLHVDEDERDRLLCRQRLSRALTDHLLRRGYSETASQLVQEESIVDLVELEAFSNCQIVIEALRERDCSKGLQWCGSNRAKLNRNESSLEFKFRLQEFVELLRGASAPSINTSVNANANVNANVSANNNCSIYADAANMLARMREAILHARTHFSSYKHSKEVQEAMACLVFLQLDGDTTTPSAYQVVHTYTSYNTALY
jgi:hypothetical protein